MATIFDEHCRAARKSLRAWDCGGTPDIAGGDDALRVMLHPPKAPSIWTLSTTTLHSDG